MRHKSKLVAQLAVSWEAEMMSTAMLQAAAEKAPNDRVRARLAACAAGCQAHSSRLLARMAAVGGGPLPVPPPPGESKWEESNLDLQGLLWAVEQHTKITADHYSEMAQLARKCMNPSAAWVCELNRAEEFDTAHEIKEMRQKLKEAEEQENQGAREKRTKRRSARVP